MAAANKRIVSILKKAEARRASPTSRLLQGSCREGALPSGGRGGTAGAFARRQRGLHGCAAFSPDCAAVDQFFEDVMVMAEEPLTRANRIAFAQLAGLMNQVADISRLSA